MGTTIDFNQPIEVIVMALAGRIDRIEDAAARSEANIAKRHDQNRWRLNVIIALAGIAVSATIGVLGLIAHLSRH